MKVLFSIIALTFFTFSSQTLSTTNDKDGIWLTDYKKALKKSKKSGKHVLLYFSGSDWCGPCKSLQKDLFETDDFKTIAKNYVLLYIDIPRNQDLLTPAQYNHNKNVLAQHNKKGVFPLLKVLNNKGNKVAEMSGYSMNGEVRYHLDFLRKHQ